MKIFTFSTQFKTIACLAGLRQRLASLTPEDLFSFPSGQIKPGFWPNRILDRRATIFHIFSTNTIYIIKVI
jgi:hypothetical protein